jgi:ferredoxin
MPLGVSVEFEPGTSVLVAAAMAGIEILAPCAGRGTCGKCAVRVLEGDAGPADAVPGRAPMPGTMRLACMLCPEGDVTVSPAHASVSRSTTT